MLKYIESFPKQGIRLQKGSRIRILGRTNEEKLLYLVNTSKGTSIELVSIDGSSITALHFNEYLDIISADLSNDQEVLHFTHRTSNLKGFGFISIIYHIHSPARSKEFTSDQPINAFFLPNCQSPNYQLIHIVGDKMAHLNAILTKKFIEIERLRGGINIPSVIFWDYQIEKFILYVIHEVNNQFFLSDFDVRNLKVTNHTPIQISINPLSKLPHELSLNPLALKHLPYFRCFNNRFFVTKFNSKICIIQQLYEGPDSNLMFGVYLYPRPYIQIVPIPNISSETNLCILQFESIIIIFVPNQFIYLIDILQNPPFVSLQLNPFSIGLASNNCSTISNSKYLIDLSNSLIYNINIDLTNSIIFKNTMNKSRWDLFCIISSRIQDINSISGIFNLLNNFEDISIIDYFIQKLFKYLIITTIPRSSSAHISLKRNHSKNIKLPIFLNNNNNRINNNEIKQHSLINNLPENNNNKLNEIDIEFPSASKNSRKHSFKIILRQIIQQNGSKNFEKSISKAFKKLDFQNNTVINLRNSLDNWIKLFQPNQFWVFIISFLLENETIFNDFPKIFALRNEIELLLINFGTESIRRHLEHSHVINPSRRNEFIDEMDFWSNKIIYKDLLDDSSISSNSNKSTKFLFNRTNNSSNDLSENGSSIYFHEKSDTSDRIKK